MSGRAAAVRNRLLVVAGAVLLAWLFGWTSDLGLLMLLVAAAAVVLAVMRGLFGGLPVLLHWLLRYRAVDIGLRALGDIIGEHSDDMQRAGLAVRQPRRRQLWHGKGSRRPRERPDLIPRLRHRPYAGGIVVTLEAVRAGMSQDEIVRAVPRLRSAWGVDVIEAEAKPGGRAVELRIPLGNDAPAPQPVGAVDRAERDPGPERASRPVGSAAARPPDAPPVTVVQGSDQGERTELVATRGDRPPTFRPKPALEPDERGRYELEMLPLDAARTFSPRPPESSGAASAEREQPNPPTAEIPLVADGEIGRNAPDPVRPEAADEVFDGTRIPTDIDERSLRIGAQWRTGRER